MSWGRMIAAAPFAAWLASERDKLEQSEEFRGDRPRDRAGAVRALAERFEISERGMYRYMHQLGQRGGRGAAFVAKVDEFARQRVEDLLDNADVELWEVAEFARERGIPGWRDYVEEDVELEPDRPCATCRQVVTPIHGVCPWCESVLLRRGA